MAKHESEQDNTTTLPEDLTFEAAMERLADLVDRMESDELTLEDSLAAHEEGVLLSRFCLERLEAAELRVQELSLE